MAKILDAAVTESEGGWDFQCPGVRGSLCGDRETGRPFHSDGWPTKKAALARGQLNLRYGRDHARVKREVARLFLKHRLDFLCVQELLAAPVATAPKTNVKASLRLSAEAARIIKKGTSA